MKIKLFLALSIILITSCSEHNSLPLKQSERIQKVANTHKPILLNTQNTALEGLFNFVGQYNSNDLAFNLDLFEEQYDMFSETYITVLNREEAAKWVQINALLLELTTNSQYAEELETTLQTYPDLNVVVQPLFVTKNTDHLFVNIFQPTVLNYTHTLGGEVSFKMETQYPKSGSVQLHFGMTIKRYIELYIRIPEWAEGATVTVKQVKYFVQPGSYCKIAKKWKEGDLVEIELPIEKLQNSNSKIQISSIIQ